MTITLKCASIAEDQEDDAIVRVTLTSGADKNANKNNNVPGGMNLLPGMNKINTHTLTFPVPSDQANQFVVGKDYSVTITAV